MDSGATYDSTNLWHRVCAGASSNNGEASALVAQGTTDSDFFQIENDESWVDSLTSWVERPERQCIAIADNAEGYYFLQGLLPAGVSQQDEGARRVAAQRLVRLARTELAGTILILLSNDRRFLEDLQEHVEAQHGGLMSLVDIPLPGPADKERAVRVNINRLNEFPTALSKATQRVAVTWEFTSQQRTDGSTISDYLGQKLANYVRVTQEQ